MELFQQLKSLISPKLTWEVFEEVLQRQNNCSNIKILNITIGDDTKKGDSYLSNVSRFSVEYSGNVNGKNQEFELHVIAKALLKNIARRKTFRSYDFFRNEITFYEKVWPQLDAFQKATGKDLFEEIPNYLCGHCDGVDDYILLEDLSFQGYKGVDRSVPLSLGLAKMVMRVFARFHALGIALKQTKPDIFKETALQLQETHFHEKLRTWYNNFYDKLKLVTLDAVQQELPQDYGKKLEELFKRDGYGETNRLCLPNPSAKFTTITHGDAWIPNFLMRYDNDNQPTRSKMIDFQLTRCGSLAQDIHFFIYACTDADLRQHYDEILKYYCQEFNSFWSELCPHSQATQGIEGTVGTETFITYEELIEELKRNAIFGFSMAMEAVVMSVLDDDEVSDLENLEGEEAVPLETVWIIKPLKSQEKRIRLASFVKHMYDNQFL